MSYSEKILKAILTILSAALGIRSSKNMIDDFNRNSPFIYIALGIIFTILFVISLILIINKFIL